MDNQIFFSSSFPEEILRYLKTDFMVQIYEFFQKGSEAIIFTTANYPWDIDLAIRKRLDFFCKFQTDI